MKRKNIVLALSVLMLMSAATYAEVQIDSVSIEPSHIEAGDEVDVYVKFHEAPNKRDVFTGAKKGTSGGNAITDDPNTYYTAVLMAKGELAKDYVRIFESEKNVGHLFTGESWTTPFKLKISEAAEAADYRMEFQVIQKNINGEKTGIARFHEFTVPIRGSAKFSIEAINDLKLGNSNTFKVTVKNVGGGTARHVQATINASDPLTILDAGEAYIGTLKARDEASITYKVSVKSSAMLGPVTIPLKIAYTDDTGTENMLTKTLGATITGKPDISIVLDSSEALKPGSMGVVTLDVINRGFVDVKFLSIRLMPSDVFTLNSSEEVYIGNLDSDDSESQDFTVKIANGASPGKIPLRVQVEFKKENIDRVYTKDETVELTVFSEAEYLEASKANGGQQDPTTYLLIIPGIIIAYLVVWVIFRIIGLITGLLDKKVFKRRTSG